MKIETLAVDFTDEQKRYLEGFTTGLQISRVGRGLGGGTAGKTNAEPTGPEAAHIKAQDKITASGKKLADQEKYKREEHPFDAYPRLKQQALDNAPPNPADNFRWRYYGLFYVAPAQDSYMCRLRIPNGILKHWQFSGMADLAERLCGPFCNVTTRANLQVREIPPKHAVALIEGIQDLGLCSRGSGADNIRNVTGTPTAGIDPQELLDTRPYAREWHYHILNDRSLTGLPRKFNVAFDGAGRIAVLEDTNDIAFAAVEVKDGFDVEPGIWFRLGIGGITGHKDFAKAIGIIVKPANATRVADAIVRVFIDLGDRTNRLKARLKYVIDGMGMDKFLVLVEEKLGQAFTRVPPEAFAPRPAFDRMAHIGVHKQKQEGLNWIGVSLPLGKVTCEQMRGLAKIAQDLGDGELRLRLRPIDDERILQRGLFERGAQHFRLTLFQVGAFPHNEAAGADLGGERVPQGQRNILGAEQRLRVIRRDQNGRRPQKPGAAQGGQRNERPASQHAERREQRAKRQQRTQAT